MIDINKKYETRLGYPVVLLAKIPGLTYPILGLYKPFESDTWYSMSWTENGNKYESGKIDDDDLVESIKTVCDFRVKIYEKYENMIHGAFYNENKWVIAEWTTDGHYRENKEYSSLDLELNPKPLNYDVILPTREYI